MIDVPLCCRPTYCTHTVKKACFAKLPLRFAISDVITRSEGGAWLPKFVFKMFQRMGRHIEKNIMNMIQVVAG